MPRPWNVAELTLADLRARPVEVVILPFGATEPHNLHLPYGTDTMEADLIADLVGSAATARGASVGVLPTIPFGTQTNQQAFPLAMNLQPSTLLAILRDLVGSLERTGVRKCLILNSHGGNTFKGHLRELFGQTEVHLFLCNWFALGKDRYRDVFSKPEDHAGEMETSLLLHARPDLVRMAQIDSTPVRPLRFEALRQGWIELTRPWHLLTPHSGSGDPAAAHADKGKRWLEIIVPPITDFVVELAASPLDDQFPFQPQ